MVLSPNLIVVAPGAIIPDYEHASALVTFDALGDDVVHRRHDRCLATA